MSTRNLSGRFDIDWVDDYIFAEHYIMGVFASSHGSVVVYANSGPSGARYTL